MSIERDLYFIQEPSIMLFVVTINERKLFQANFCYSNWSIKYNCLIFSICFTCLLSSQSIERFATSRSKPARHVFTVTPCLPPILDITGIYIFTDRVIQCNQYLPIESVMQFRTCSIVYIATDNSPRSIYPSLLAVDDLARAGNSFHENDEFLIPN